MNNIPLEIRNLIFYYKYKINYRDFVNDIARLKNDYKIYINEYYKFKYESWYIIPKIWYKPPYRFDQFVKLKIKRFNKKDHIDKQTILINKS